MSELNNIVDLAIEIRNEIGSEIYDSTYELYRVEPQTQELPIDNLDTLSAMVDNALRYTSRIPKLITSLVKVHGLPSVYHDTSMPISLNTRHVLTSVANYDVTLPDDAEDGTIIAFLWGGVSGSVATITPFSDIGFDTDISNLTVGDVGLHFFKYNGIWGVCKRNGDVAVVTGVRRVSGGYLHTDKDRMTLHLKTSYGHSVTWPIKWPDDYVLMGGVVSNVPASYADADGYYVNKDFSKSSLSLIDVSTDQPTAIDGKAVTVETSTGQRCFVFISEPYTSTNRVSVYEIKSIGTIIKVSSWTYPDSVKHGICAVTPYINNAGNVRLYMSANGYSANSAATGTAMMFSVSFDKETGIIGNDVTDIPLNGLGQYVATSIIHKVGDKLILAVFNEYGRSTTVITQSGTNPTGLAFMSSDDGITWTLPLAFGYANTHTAAKCFKVIDGQLYAAMAHVNGAGETYPTKPFMLQCIGVNNGSLSILKTAYQLNEMYSAGTTVAGISFRSTIVTNNGSSALISRGAEGWYVLRLEKDTDSLYKFSNVSVPSKTAISSSTTTQRICEAVEMQSGTLIIEPFSGGSCAVRYTNDNWVIEPVGGGYGSKKMSCSIDFNGYKYVAMVGYSTDISYASTIDLYKVENIEDNLERFIDITGIRVK